jgi:hypothetical protein
LHDPHAVELYGNALGRVAEIEVDEETRDWFLSRIYDVMEDGFEGGVISREAVAELACNIGRIRHHVPVEDERAQDTLDDYAINLAAMYYELPEDDTDPVSATEGSENPTLIEVDDGYVSGERDHIDAAVDRLLANTYIFARGRGRQLPEMRQQPWLKPESYEAVAHHFTSRATTRIVSRRKRRGP